jgi:hypothetical protein
VADHVQLVLDDEQRVPRGLEPVERPQQGLRVGRVQPRRRLVEDVDDAEQVRPHLRRQPQPLQFAGGQRRRTAVERQVAQPQVEQDGQPALQVLRDAAGDLGLLRVVGRELYGSGRVRPEDGRQP